MEFIIFAMNDIVPETASAWYFVAVSIIMQPTTSAVEPSFLIALEPQVLNMLELRIIYCIMCLDAVYILYTITRKKSIVNLQKKQDFSVWYNFLAKHIFRLLFSTEIL